MSATTKSGHTSPSSTSRPCPFCGEPLRFQPSCLADGNWYCDNNSCRPSVLNTSPLGADAQTCECEPPKSLDDEGYVCPVHSPEFGEPARPMISTVQNPAAAGDGLSLPEQVSKRAGELTDTGDAQTKQTSADCMKIADSLTELTEPVVIMRSHDPEAFYALPDCEACGGTGKSRDTGEVQNDANERIETAVVSVGNGGRAGIAEATTLGKMVGAGQVKGEVQNDSDNRRSGLDGNVHIGISGGADLRNGNTVPTQPGAGQVSTAASAEQHAVELGRELYDRFVMGGWEPQDAHKYIENTLIEYATSRVGELEKQLAQAQSERLLLDY